MVKQIYFKHRNAASAIFNNALVENYKENFDAGRISVEKKMLQSCRNYRMEVSRKIFLREFFASNKKGG